MFEDNYQSRLLLAWASYWGGLNYNNFQKTKENYPNLVSAFKDNFGLLSPELQKKLRAKFENYNSDSFANLTAKNNLEFVVYGDQDYPKSFTYLSNPPLAFFYKGDLSLLNHNAMITIVGSRTYSSYAQYLLQHILYPVLCPQICVVSGLALGVDTLCHQLVVKNPSLQAKTIGIIGSGLDAQSFYPKSNLNLAKQIVDQQGLLISEYPPGVVGFAHHFPARNRLLASLSKTTWVVQASLKSGSLITARLALEQGKNVATCPADIRDQSFTGNLELMKNGAIILTQAEDLISLMNIDVKISKSKGTKNFTDANQTLIWEVLKQSPKNVDQIAAQTGLNTNIIATTLTTLEMQGEIFNSGQNIWQIS